jgi:hypothetical protein
MDSNEERDARRAAALRANLRRRKEQARGVKDEAAGAVAAEDQPPTNRPTTKQASPAR